MEEGAGVMLGLFMHQPTRKEVASVHTPGQVRYGWFDDGLTGYLLFKFGSSAWSFAPFSPDRLTEPFDLELTEPGTHKLTHTFLVESRDGLIVAMRRQTWPGYFHNTVVESVRRIEKQPYSEPEARARQQAFEREHSDGPSLYRRWTALPNTARCLGGQRDDVPFSSSGG